MKQTENIEIMCKISNCDLAGAQVTLTTSFFRWFVDRTSRRRDLEEAHVMELERLFTTNPISPCVWLYNSLQPSFFCNLLERNRVSCYAEGR